MAGPSSERLPNKLPPPDEIRFIDEHVTNSPTEYRFGYKTLQHEFKHAGDFGVGGNPNPAKIEEFANAIHKHTDGADFVVEGTFRWKQNVVHYFNKTTRLWAAFDVDSRMLVGAWQLGEQQAADLIGKGNVF